MLVALSYRLRLKLRAAVITTSATSFGCEIITTWEAPSISVICAFIRS
jgi:hypothetical protein